jgi:hypothetical protein
MAISPATNATSQWAAFRSLDRQKRVAFSTAYMVNGKTPLVRCADVQKFQTVADIDKPGVKVIANPGGSNERFAKANFKQASLTIHSDNIGIFDEVLKGNADVFVTESAEAIVQQRQKPGLCAVNPDKPLQYGGMAYMLPRGDVVTKQYIDQWLHLAKASGEYQRIVALVVGIEVRVALSFWTMVQPPGRSAGGPSLEACPLRAVPARLRRPTSVRRLLAHVTLRNAPTAQATSTRRNRRRGICMARKLPRHTASGKGLLSGDPPPLLSIRYWPDLVASVQVQYGIF